MNWTAHYDGHTLPAGPGQDYPREGLVALEVDGYRVEVPDGAEVVRLERHSIGGVTWDAAIIAIDEDIHILRRQTGWGTDVLTGRPG